MPGDAADPPVVCRGGGTALTASAALSSGFLAVIVSILAQRPVGIDPLAISPGEPRAQARMEAMLVPFLPPPRNSAVDDLLG